ncbi:helix-turn-helix transcriptional regulator, partial [Robinsoniella sp.]
SSGSNLLLEYAATREPDYSIDLPKIRQNITLHLNGKDEKTFSDYIEVLFSSIEKKHSVDYLYLIVTELFMTFHIYYHILENTPTNINEFISSILDEEYTLESLKNTAIHYGLQCIQQNDTSPSDVALSKKLMSYIDEHYHNQDLSVAQIGDIFQLNPSYMGSVFKKVNDISILQYITNVRMEASKRLLESNQYKISEIAEQVGYSDVFYFSKRFKKSYGYSPKDYALRNKS